MLEALKFVKGAVARKDYVPALTHFRIENGLIKGYNGRIGLCCPISLDIAISPKAVPFAKAILTCKSTVEMHVTKSGRLAIKSGKFKAFVECTEETFPHIYPEGEKIPLNGDFLPAIKRIAPFIAEDASRPWARGIMFDGQSAFATNNLILVQCWMDSIFPAKVNVPQSAIKELLRINIEPEYIQVTENSITFHYGDDKWLRSALLDLEWPDILSILNASSPTVKHPPEIFEAVEDLTPFVDEAGKIYLLGDRITTDPNEDIGASIAMEGLPEQACFNNKQLLLLKDVADIIDFTNYPKPCPFSGGPIRGVIIGIRIL